MDAYREDLAYIHDKGYAAIALDAAARLVDELTSLPTCVAVTAVGEVINYTFDLANDDAARVELFRRVYAALVPGGIFLLDAAGPKRAPSGQSLRTHAVGPDWAVLVETTVERDSGLLTRRITSFRQVDTLYRRDDEVHRLILVNPDAVLQSLHGAGFEVEIIARYKAIPLPAGVVAFVARKSVANAV